MTPAPLDSEAVLLAWAESRATALGPDGAVSAFLRTHVTNPIEALVADPRRMVESFMRGARMGRAREQSRAALGFLVATGVLAPSRKGPRPKPKN
jgi:hypothetical protein